MSRDEIHQIATQTTPEHVKIPETWNGLIIWAAGKWGVGIIFAAMLVPVYSDLKASNQQLADISRANVSVLMQLAQQIEMLNERSNRIEESIRQITRDKS